MFLRWLVRWSANFALAGALVIGLMMGAVGPANAQGYDDPGLMNKVNYLDRTPGNVSADPIPSMRLDGPGNAVATTSKYAFIGGEFSSVTDPDGRIRGGLKNLAVMDIETGYFVDFRLSFDGKVNSLSISPDKQRLYVAGKFNSITDKNGTRHWRRGIVEISINGQPNAWGITPFRWTGVSIEWGSAGGEGVSSVAAANDYIFIAGGFLYVDGHRRNNVAAFSRSGSLIGFYPAYSDTNYERVSSVAVSPSGDRVFVGGAFSGLSNRSAKGLAQYVVGSWQMAPMAISDINTATRASAGVTSISTDDDSVYASYFLWKDSQDNRWGNTEGTAANSIYSYDYKWMGDCHGDTTANGVMNGVVYASGHNHDCVNIGSLPHGAKFKGGDTSEPVGMSAFSANRSPRLVDTNTYKTYAYGNFGGHPAPYTYQFYPDIFGYDGAQNNVRHIAGNGRYLIAVGMIWRTNGKMTDGLVRFGTAAVGAAKKEGPGRVNPLFSVKAQPGTNVVELSWRSVFDPDDYTLRYTVYRDGVLAHQEVSPGVPVPLASGWQHPRMTWRDYAATPGAAHEYRLVITDRDGNRMEGGSTRVVAGFGGAVLDGYSTAVAADGPDHFWTLDDAAAGTHVADLNGLAPIAKGGGISPATGINGVTNGALRLEGQPTSWAVMPHREIGAREFSVELWVKPESSGKLVGFHNTMVGAAEQYNRYLYINDAREVVFVSATATGPNGLKSTPIELNAWHHVVGTVGPLGKTLYVDGVQVAFTPAVTGEEVHPGHWRIGAGPVSPRFGAVSNPNLTGVVDAVATYDLALTATQVAKHYGALKNSAPKVDFGVTCQGLACKFTSFAYDLDNNIAGFVWELGDGKTSTQRNPVVTYSAPGSYPVTLTVTDGMGKSGQYRMTVRVGA